MMKISINLLILLTMLLLNLLMMIRKPAISRATNSSEEQRQPLQNVPGHGAQQNHRVNNQKIA